MKSTNTDNISCLIFGHNFYKPTKGLHADNTLICKNCKHEFLVDEYGDFQSSGTNNKTFEATLRKLFLLRRRLTI